MSMKNWKKGIREQNYETKQCKIKKLDRYALVYIIRTCLYGFLWAKK